MGVLGRLLINQIRKDFEHYFYEKYKKLLKKLIVLSIFNRIFLKLVPKLMSLSHLLTFSYFFMCTKINHKIQNCRHGPVFQVIKSFGVYLKSNKKNSLSL